MQSQIKCGSSSVGRASAFQAECREFDPRLPLLEKQNEVLKIVICGSSSVGRASAFQAECREFDPRLPLLENKTKFQKSLYAEVAQLVERQPSKLNVASSTLVFRSWNKKVSKNLETFFYCLILYYHIPLYKKNASHLREALFLFVVYLFVILTVQTLNLPSIPHL